MRKHYSLQNTLLFIAVSLVISLGNYQISFSQVEMKTAKIQLRFFEKDSIKMVEAKVNKITSGKIGDPVANIEVKFYVERTFSLLPFGGRFTSTDENGLIEVEFPKNLPGDSAGLVHVIAKISESEEYKDTETSETLNWGIPTHLKDATLKRSIWAAAANAPIALLILVNSMIAVVWLFMFYIVYRLFKISRM
jgi:hypothetical protein